MYRRQRLEDGPILLGLRLKGKLFADTPMGGQAHAAAQEFAAEQVEQATGERGRIARRHEVAANAVVHDFRRSSDGRGDHRNTGRQRFEHGVRQPLGVGGEHRHVEAAKPAIEVVAEPGQDEMLLQAKLCDAAAERLVQGTVAEQHKAGLWTLLVSASILSTTVLPAWLGVIGVPIGVAVAIGTLEFVGSHERDGWAVLGPVVPIAYLAWSVWLIGLGVFLLM